MARTLDLLARKVTINGAETVDARMIVVEDGRAVLIGKPDGDYAALATMNQIIEWGITGAGAVRITDGVNVWEGIRDTRCGSCGGRYQLRHVDKAPFMPPLIEDVAE